MAYDWALIKREYVQGCPDEDGAIKYPTLDHLCERHGCAFSTIAKKSSNENWIQERKLFDKKKERKIFEKKEELMVNESANLDNKALDAANKGIEIGLKRLEDKQLSNPDFLKISNALTNFHKMGKLALGEETEHTKTTGKTDVEVSIHERIKDYDEYFKDLDNP